MSTTRDYYEILNVSKNSDDKEIKKSYRKLAMQYHPDRNASKEAEEKFKEASEAYEVLSDSKKRQIYDLHGHNGLRNTGYSGFQQSNIEDIFSGFGDIFGDFFGFNRSNSRGQKGADLHYELSLDFQEAAFGCKKEIVLEQSIICEKCKGLGAKPGSSPVVCATCKGQGQVAYGQGMFIMSSTCKDCRGQGKYYKESCSDCKGQGKKRVERNRTINVPAGVDDGVSIRYANEGDPGIGGDSGHLYIDINVRRHKTLKRDGADLFTEIKLNIVQVILGSEVTIEGIDGHEYIKIPKGTQPEDMITLKNKGVPKVRGRGRGNLHILCHVEIPRSLSRKQRKLFEEIGKEPL